MRTDQNDRAFSLIKQLGEWAVLAGRFFQSEQTGFVHYTQGSLDQKSQTIPLYENFLFSYALLRSKSVEQAQEAKNLLKGLLAFQNRQQGNENGNFPVFLHEYPNCRNPSLGLQLLAPVYWILKQFGHVLGKDLKIELEKASVDILAQSFSAHRKTPFSYFLEIHLGAARLAFGKLLENEVWIKEGEEFLCLLSCKQLDGWQTTRQLGDSIVGLQMAFSSFKESPWNSLWKWMEQTWHSQLNAYTGPSLREWQMGVEPQINLYDLYGGFFSGQFAERVKVLNPCHLKGILIQPSLDKFETELFPGNLKGTFQQMNWEISSQSDWACTLFEKKEKIHPSQEKTHTPCRLIWGDLKHLHSLVCQGGYFETAAYGLKRDAFELYFDLKEDAPLVDNAPKREVEFFVDFQPGIFFRINGKASTTFELNQTIEIIAGHRHMTIVFELVVGEGRFFGHIMRGNRPSQIKKETVPNSKNLAAKTQSAAPSYDWTIFLRTLQRSPQCRIKATLRLSPTIDQK